MKERKSPTMIILIFIGLIIVFSLIWLYSNYNAITAKPVIEDENLADIEKQNLIEIDTVIEENQETVTTDKNNYLFNQEEYDSSMIDLLFLKIENKKENKIYSPLSIKYALSMLKEATNGESQKQIINILGNQKPTYYKSNKNLSLANSFFIRDTFKSDIKESYINLLKNNYNAEINYDSFEDANNINNWIKAMTFDIIPNMTDDETVKNLDFALINAVAIDMEWKYKFLNKYEGNQYSGTTFSHEKRDLPDHLNWEKIDHDDENAYEKFDWDLSTQSALDIYAFENVESKMFKNDENELNVSGMLLTATINNYDIVNELGEENIKNIVAEEYRKFAKGEEYDSEHAVGDFPLSEDVSDEGIQKDLDVFLPSYISEIDQNYHKIGSTTDFSLYTDEDVKVFAKDLKEYDGTTLQYVGIMPISENLDNFVENVELENINKYISNLKDVNNYKDFKEGVVTKIIGYIPKFKFEYNLDLKEDLEKCNVTDVFSIQKADLSNLTDSESYISTALHKANIEFTQDGIKAAAATMLGGEGAGTPFDYYFSVPIEEIDITFDKPYMFIIRDKDNGEIWFTGTVYEPLLWENEPENPQNREIY